MGPRRERVGVLHEARPCGHFVWHGEDAAGGAVEPVRRGVKSEEEEATRETVGGSLLREVSSTLVRPSVSSLHWCPLAHRRDLNLETNGTRILIPLSWCSKLY